MLTIIIPAYNEEQRIEATLQDYLNYFKDQNIEILVILNGCTDRTLDIVKSFNSEKINYLDISEAIGKGGAIIEGFKIAKGDLISYIDADNSTKPLFLDHLIKNLGTYDGVMGSRYAEGANILTKQPILRRIASRSFRHLTRIILNLKYIDTQAGAKVFKREAIHDILPQLTITGWGFDVNILYKLKQKNYKVKEVPIDWADHGESKLKMRKAIPGMFKTLLKIRFGK